MASWWETARRHVGRRVYRVLDRRPVRFGRLRRTTPIDPAWGFRRGRPIDRTYIDDFVRAHREDICGRVLEIGAPSYIEKFGSDVRQIDVLVVDESMPGGTIVADLVDAPQIADDTFDCAIVTQTLQFIRDTPAALRTLHRILRPGGVLLLTVPGITKISAEEDAEWGEWWHFTNRSIGALVGDCFGDDVTVQSYGNVLTAISFLHGLAAQDLKPAEIDAHDPLYEVVIGVRARKRPA